MSTPNTDREDAPADRNAERVSRNGTAHESPGPQSCGPESPLDEAANRKNAGHQGAAESSGPSPDVIPEIVSPRLSPSGKQKTPFGDAGGWAAADLPIVDAVFESVPPRKRPPSAEAAAPADRWTVLVPETNAASAPAQPPAPPARSFGLRAIIMTAAAAVIGALAGSLTTAGLGYMVGTPSAGPSYDQVFADGLARIDHQVTVLKGAVEGSGRTQSQQIAKIVERLDRAEKAQNDAGTRLAKASDVLDRVERRLAASGEVTGALGEAHASPPSGAAPSAPAAAPPAATAAAATAAAAASAAAGAPAKPKQPPVVEGWVLRDVYDGSALIQGRGGLVAVMPGDSVPGLGRVEAVKRQDGRWVVVTARGLVMPR
jgi:hypothetical protein